MADPGDPTPRSVAPRRIGPGRIGPDVTRRGPRTGAHRPVSAGHPSPATRSWLSRLSNKQLALLGIVVPSVVAVVVAVIGLVDRPTNVPSEAGGDIAALGDGPGDGETTAADEITDHISSISHLAAVVTVLDPADYKHFQTDTPWLIDTEASSPSGELELRITAGWNPKDDVEPPLGLAGDPLPGDWIANPTGDASRPFLDGGMFGMALGSAPGTEPGAMLMAPPAESCEIALQVVDIDLQGGMTAAVQVQSGCREQSYEDAYGWVEVVVATPSGQESSTLECVVISVIRQRDISAVTQILGSMLVSPLPTRTSELGSR